MLLHFTHVTLYTCLRCKNSHRINSELEFKDFNGNWNGKKFINFLYIGTDYMELTPVLEDFVKRDVAGK